MVKAKFDPETGAAQAVVVVDLDISFLNLIGLLVKVAIAAIPAIIILIIFGAMAAGVLAGLFKH